MEQLAKALREEMNRRNHSFRDAATAMGVSSGSVVNWSKGWIEESPRIRNLQALAEYLGHPDYIVFGMVGWLTPDQVEVLQTIPGSIELADQTALFLVVEAGYLNPADGKVLASAASWN